MIPAALRTIAGLNTSRACDERRVQNAPSDEDLPDHAVLGRQQQRVELLLVEVAQMWLHAVEHVSRAADAVSRISLLGVGAPSELQRRRNPRRGGRSHAGDGRDAERRQRSQPADGPVRHAEHGFGDLEGRAVPAAAPDQDSQQFAAREGRRPERDESLPGTLGLR